MKKIVFSSFIAIVLIIACKSGSETKSNSLTINLEPKSGSTVSGTATFTEKNGTVTFTTKISGLKPGVHGIHIHEKADCSAADAASAGGHWNPTHTKHGKWTDAEHHKGDIGNITADEKGNATMTLKTTEWCIGCGDETKDILGKGLIVHANPDDFTTQPTGNAGGRIACSAIIR
ncbi:superoxide dismutase [Cu-Zn] [Flavobacterium lutivivi]|nr:superoxide dismutase [Cu-Zn] [Flavobacterium lutivivi]